MTGLACRGTGLNEEVPSQHPGARPSQGWGDSPSTAAPAGLALGLNSLCACSPLGLGWPGTCLLVVWVWREQDGGTFVFTDIDKII